MHTGRLTFSTLPPKTDIEFLQHAHYTSRLNLDRLPPRRNSARLVGCFELGQPRGDIICGPGKVSMARERLVRFRATKSQAGETGESDFLGGRLLFGLAAASAGALSTTASTTAGALLTAVLGAHQTAE